MSEQSSITLSREVLRLELDNLALRLTNELATKGEAAEIASRQDAFDRGELSTGMLLAMKAIVLQEMNNRVSLVWSLRANKAAWVVPLLSFSSLAVSLYVAYTN